MSKIDFIDKSNFKFDFGLVALNYNQTSARAKKESKWLSQVNNLNILTKTSQTETQAVK